MFVAGVSDDISVERSDTRSKKRSLSYDPFDSFFFNSGMYLKELNQKEKDDIIAFADKYILGKSEKRMWAANDEVKEETTSEM